MPISVSNIKTTYQTYRNAVGVTATAYEDRANLGGLPAYPNITETDADYNDVTATRTTWFTDYADATTAIGVAVTDQNAKELLCIAQMPTNQWVTLTGLTGAPTTQYIGVDKSRPDPKLVVLNTLPTLHFPNY